jgi:hypothetical protein
VAGGRKILMAGSDEWEDPHPMAQPACNDRVGHYMRTQFLRRQPIPHVLGFKAFFAAHFYDTTFYAAVLYTVVYDRITITRVNAKSVEGQHEAPPHTVGCNTLAISLGNS